MLTLLLASLSKPARFSTRLSLAGAALSGSSHSAAPPIHTLAPIRPIISVDSVVGTSEGFTRQFAEEEATKQAINNGWLKGRQRKLSVVTKEEFMAVKTPKQLSTLGNQVNYFVGVFDGKNLNVQQASRNEAWSKNETGGWALSPYGNSPFDENSTKKDTYSSSFYGKVVCKRDNVSKRKGAAAIAVATPAGHISFGLSGKTNGEKKLAQAVGLVDTLARKAAHGIDVSTLAVGAVIVFKAEPADIAGEVMAVLRLGGDKPHWAEKGEPTMAFVRTGGPGMAKAPPSLERQLKQLKKIRSDNCVTAKSPAIVKKSAALKKKGTHGVGMLTAGADKPNAVAAAKGAEGGSANYAQSKADPTRSTSKGKAEGGAAALKPELTRDHVFVQCNECLVGMPVPAQKHKKSGVLITFGKTAHLPSCSLCTSRAIRMCFALPGRDETKLVGNKRFTVRRVK